MEINPTIFKSYDIRGVYPSELNEEAAYLIGRAFARRTKAKKVTVGSDMRLSSPALKRALVRGITDEGVNVKDIGLVPIDAIYFSVGKLGDQAGIMITASHNPPEYNGFKMVLKDMKWIRWVKVVELLEEVKNLPAKINGTKGEAEGGDKGTIEEEDITSRYVNHILSFVEVDKIKPFKVVADAGNGMAGKIMPILIESLPINMIPLNFKLDGSFPAHPSNPLLPESQKEICAAVVKEKADFGIIMDGDTDRLFFVDEKGSFIPADMTLLLLAKLFLEREPGAGIVYNLLASKIVPEMLKKWGGRPLISKVGYANISTVMREQNGIMGGEASAHYCFRDNSYTDSGFIAFVILLQLLSNYEQPLSELVKPFYKYFKSPEMNFKIHPVKCREAAILPEAKLFNGVNPVKSADEVGGVSPKAKQFDWVKDKDAVLEKVKQKYSDGKQNFLDGITVEYDNWWFNVRPSNTEPLLRLTIEADTKELLDQKQKELSDFVKR